MANNLEIKNIKKLIGKKHVFKRYTMFILALLLLSASYNLFILPNDLVFGGVSGIAVITKNIIDPSLFILIVNFFLIGLSFIFLGKEKTIGSILGVFLYPLFIKLTSNIGEFIVLENADIFINVLFAGFLSGLATGTILKYGFSTGGTDIAAQIISKIFKISVGKGILLVDSIIILVGGYYFGIVKVMYAIVMLYIYSLIADKIMLGIADNKAFYIITSKEEELKKYIFETLNHGVTILKAKGGYEERKENVLLCVVPAHHYFKLKEGISMIDSNAFFVVTDAYEVKGGA
ncbi:MAG: YitT family protein [Bacilli bacterium]|nr:YitT family protein [Bacilli bacterium]MDD3305161.1 YitT family protein [Bacilli bacterium]MDD4053986.1 YitT family protein [Bacilli bacterium]MDD4411733.1 YitT family protein [Bacilli bacterium]